MITCQNLYYTPPKSSFGITITNERFEHKGITAFIGKNGSGKSTMFKLISGTVKATSGYIAYQGDDVFMKFEDIKSDIHLLTGAIHLYEHLTVAEHIKLIKKIAPIWNDEIEQKLTNSFELNSSVKVEQLSNGQLAKLKLLLSLSRMPKVILIDEITNDLDLTTREFIYQALDEYTYENDSYVFLATNIIEDMERYASNIVMISDGTIIENDTLDNLKEKHSFNLENIYKKFNSKEGK